MTDADHLLAWREAYLGRGLPRPVRADRWQVLRAGVANLWEFDTAEYWYADGWVQLTGRNETGKSSLMALTTLIPWLGDVSPNNIDTLGTGRGKQFRYYVEPTDTDGDRRDPGTSTNRGWLWVEYGRLNAAGEPEFFTTLGFFQARRAAQDYDRRWITVDGPHRVRAGIDLIVARSVQGPSDLPKQAGDATVHPTAAAYRAHVASRLFGADADALEAIGKMLRVARTPKLGQALSEHFVTTQLRDSLPSLEPAEVGKLAEGWDELDKIRVEVETTRAAVDALRRYLRAAWRPFQQVVLRQSADTAATARNQLDEVTRRERTATGQLAAATDEQAKVDAAITEQDRQIAADERAEKDLLQSGRYRDAAQRVQQVENLKIGWQEAIGRSQDADQAVDRVRSRLEKSEAAQTAAEQEASRAEEDAAAATSALTEALDPTGVADLHTLVQESDWARITRALQDRAERLAQLGVLLRTHADDDGRARSREDQAGGLRQAADQAAEAADEAWKDARQTRDDLAVATARWAGALPTRWDAPDGFVDALVAGFPRSADGESARLIDRARAEWFGPHDRALNDAQRELERQRVQLATERADLDAERERLETAPEPVVKPPAGLRRRDRPAPDASGAPLWRLLDAPGLPEPELAGVEAALTAIGVLDAWVTPDGRFDLARDGADTVLLAGLPAHPGPSVADVVTCVDPPGPRRDVVHQLLRAVGWRTDADHAIWPDGRWQTPDRAGRAELDDGTAELIGETTRVRARERRLARLRAELDALAAQAGSVQEQLAAVAVSRRRLQDLLAALPTDDTLRTALIRAAERDEQTERAAASATAAEDEAAGLRAGADRSRAVALEYAAAHQVPTSENDREQLRNDLATAQTRLRDAVQAQKQVRDQRRLVETAAHRWVQDREDHDRATRAATRARATQQEIEHSLELLTATLDADTTQVLAEAGRLREQITAGRAAVDRLRDASGNLREQVGAARVQVQTAERDRTDRERDRDEAYEDFRDLLDHGVADELGLTLPDPDARTVAATRSQVSAVRDQVTPRDWPADPRSKQERVQRARGKLGDPAQLDDLRNMLEQGGRTVRLGGGARLPDLEIVVDATGTPHTPREAMRRLEMIHTDLGEAYDTTMRNTLEELLGSTFINHLRQRLAAVDTLVNRINDVLGRHPTRTTRTVLRINLKPTQGASAPVLTALRGSASLLDETAQAQVREFLRTRIEGARAASVDEGDLDWGEQLAQALDYRKWWDVQLSKRAGEGGRWSPVHAASFNQQSGGARVVLLMLPLIATLIALYESTPGGPRPFWLDEALDGLDQANRTMVLELLGEFDLDVLLAGPGRLLNSAAVRAGAIFQVVRAEYPSPGADLICELWAGQQLTPLEPAALSAAADQEDTLFGVDL